MLHALRFTFIVFLISGLAYPLMITCLGQILFPMQAKGSLITNSHGVPIGSSLIGQNFTRPEYFHPRPSANDYDAANSGGSNYGPTNQKLMLRIQNDTLAFQQANSSGKTIPVDAITASASGLDPDISIRSALLQVNRVAAARHLSPLEVKRLVLNHQKQPLFAESPYINVLQLNLALDALLEQR